MRLKRNIEGCLRSSSNFELFAQVVVSIREVVNRNRSVAVGVPDESKQAFNEVIGDNLYLNSRNSFPKLIDAKKLEVNDEGMRLL